MSAQTQTTSVPALSQRALKMPRSSIRRIFNASQALQAQGASVIPLHIGDPNFDLPERIVTGVKQALDHKHTHYSPTPGIPALRAAIAKHVAQDLGLDFLEGFPSAHTAEPIEDKLTAQHVVCAVGATFGLNAIWQLLCDPGTTILLPQVYFPNYMQQCCLAGIHARLYPLSTEFQPMLDNMDTLVDESTRAILINSPSNPSGSLFPPETIRALYAFAQRHNLWIITDEAYMDFVYAGDYLSPMQVDWEQPIENRRVFAAMSFSKSFAATGLRMGWTICPCIELAQQLGLINEPLSGSLSTPLQHGLLAAFEEDDRAIRRDELSRRRVFAAAMLNESGIQVEPVAGGMFYFIDISATGMSGDEFADALLAEEHVAVVPGSGFGLEQVFNSHGGSSYQPNELASRCIRICFGVPEPQLREGLERVVRFIAKHLK